jgi:hypothetical protein
MGFKSCKVKMQDNQTLLKLIHKVMLDWISNTGPLCRLYHNVSNQSDPHYVLLRMKGNQASRCMCRFFIFGIGLNGKRLLIGPVLPTHAQVHLRLYMLAAVAWWQTYLMVLQTTIDGFSLKRSNRVLHRVTHVPPPQPVLLLFFISS